jgi:enamine deaminase RidA (YjgF/YER057c/UK114 family)
MKSLLRPDGLVRSPAFSHVAVRNPHTALAAAGATVHDLVMMTILVAHGVDIVEAYPVAAVSS